MRQLNDRITHHFRLEPLRRDDVGVYLMFRLRAAGYHGPDLFTKGAIQRISETSEGLTRRINILADKALLAAFSDGVHQIDCRQARAAIRDAQFKPLSRRFGARWVWIGGAAVAAGAIASAAYLAGSRHAASETPAAPTIAAAPAGGAVPVMVAPYPAPVSAPTSVAIAAPDPSGVRVASSGAEPPLSLAERIAATEDWLQRTPDSHYFIQLLVTDAGSQREVLDFMANNAQVLDARQVRVYRSRLSGRDRLGVIYGDYSSREQANAALAMLADISPSSRPYVREVRKLRAPRFAQGLDDAALRQ
nr:hypothetical protein [Accumulibacter sp.]